MKLELNDITKLFWTGNEATVALDAASLHIDDGEFVSLVGPSGCGKTTMLKIAAGLLPADGGAVLSDGKMIAGPQTNAGMVFQTDLLLPWRNAFQNVLLTAEARRLEHKDAASQARQLLAAVGLDEFTASLPHQLSGGMRQRVAICRALLGDPAVLFMDEPFGSLDAMTRDQIGLDLQRLWMSNPATVMFVTHSIGEAVFLADRVAIMSARPGKVEKVINIDLPRPRRLSDRESPLFASYVHTILEQFLAWGVLREYS